MAARGLDRVGAQTNLVSSGWAQTRGVGTAFGFALSDLAASPLGLDPSSTTALRDIVAVASQDLTGAEPIASLGERAATPTCGKNRQVVSASDRDLHGLRRRPLRGAGYRRR